MGILYPLMALGMLFAAVPIWLHLRRRDETNLVEFSTLRFLDDQPLARARPLWPRNWPLLLLRLAMLLLLVAAFMWPYIENVQTVVVAVSRVYILDNTLSHQVDDAFAAARDDVAQQLARQDVGTQIGVIELSSTANVVVRLGDDHTAAAEAVRRLEPSWERGAFIDAFRAAGEMLGTSLGANRRIVLLSDSQANQWTLGGDSPPFLKDIELDLPEVPATDRPNGSLSEPRARRVFRDGQHWVEAGVVLTSHGSFAPTAVVFLNRGREVARREVTLADSESQQVQTLFAEWECDPADWVVGEVAIEGDPDVLAGDNRVVFSLPPLRPGRVELLADSMFLRRALAPEVMLGRWEVQRSDGEQMADRDAAQTPDVLCLESHTLSSSLVRDTIREDLSADCGVILLVDEATPLIAGFLRELGIELESPQTSTTDPATFRYVFGEHPIFAPFQSAELGNLAEIEFTNYRRLKVRDAIPLAFSASGDPLVFEVDASPGRMLVFAFAFDRRDTNWPIHPTFIPFLDKCLAYARAQTTTTTAYEPGESVVWDIAPGAATKPVVVSRLDPQALTTPVSIPDPIRVEVRGGQARFQLPSEPGHYAVHYGDNDEIAAILDVNPSPLESDLTYDAEPIAVTAWQAEGDNSQNVEPTDRTGGLELSTLEALQQQLWWYLLIAALAAVLAETALSSRPTQDQNS